jgi:hypothetical protein
MCVFRRVGWRRDGLAVGGGKKRSFDVGVGDVQRIRAESRNLLIFCLGQGKSFTATGGLSACSGLFMSLFQFAADSFQRWGKGEGTWSVRVPGASGDCWRYGRTAGAKGSCHVRTGVDFGRVPILDYYVLLCTRTIWELDTKDVGPIDASATLSLDKTGMMWIVMDGWDQSGRAGGRSSGY